jgi:hypothetical protein
MEFFQTNDSELKKIKENMVENCKQCHGCMKTSSNMLSKTDNEKTIFYGNMHEYCKKCMLNITEYNNKKIDDGIVYRTIQQANTVGLSELNKIVKDNNNTYKNYYNGTMFKVAETASKNAQIQQMKYF